MSEDRLEKATRQLDELLRNAPKRDKMPETAWLQCPDCGDVWSKDGDDWDRRNAIEWPTIKPVQRGELLDDNGQPTYFVRCPRCNRAMWSSALHSYEKLWQEEIARQNEVIQHMIDEAKKEDAGE